MSKGGGFLAATGAQFLIALTVLALTSLAIAKLLMRRGRGTTLGAASFD